MYAKVPPDAIPILKPQLQEYKILYMKKIIIDKAKPSYKPVRGLYMIRLNKRTELMNVNDEPMDFPKYTFYLTPFRHLPQFERNNEYFLGMPLTLTLTVYTLLLPNNDIFYISMFICR